MWRLCEYSDVGAVEAAAFLKGQKEVVQAPKKEEPEDELDEMEALLEEAMWSLMLTMWFEFPVFDELILGPS